MSSNLCTITIASFNLKLVIIALIFSKSKSKSEKINRKLLDNMNFLHVMISMHSCQVSREKPPNRKF
jgi:hypothetical protein